MTRPLLPFVAASLLLFSSACTPNINDTDVDKESLTLTQLQKVTTDKGDKTLLIDARTPADYAAGHIPHAINMSVAQVSGIDGDIDPRLSKYSYLIVYGTDPASIPAKALGKRLIATGYKGVRFYPDGFMGWKANGLPIETSAAPSPR